MVDEPYPRPDWLGPGKKWTYFNEDFKHRKVDEFCAWYLKGNSDKVNTTNPKTRRLTEEEKDALARDYPYLYKPRTRLASPFSTDSASKEET